MTHYARLGVRPDASTEQIRAAYRELAWHHHPDRTGRPASLEMMEINEAWRVLSDPVLRHSYDAGLRSSVSGTSTGPTSPVPPSVSVTPARFPWRFVLGFFILATAVVLALGAVTDSGGSTPIDNIIRVGSCVDVDPQRGEAWEVSCDGPHAAEVAQLVPFDARCPGSTVSYRDRQGLGQVCVVEP